MIEDKVKLLIYKLDKNLQGFDKVGKVLYYLELIYLCLSWH